MQVPTTHTGYNASNNRDEDENADDNNEIDPPEIPDVPEIVPGVAFGIERVARGGGTESIIIAASCCTVLGDAIATHNGMNKYIL